MRGSRHRNRLISVYYLPFMIALSIFFLPKHLTLPLYEAISGSIWKLRLSCMDLQILNHSESKNRQESSIENQEKESLSLAQVASKELERKIHERKKSMRSLKKIEQLLGSSFSPLLGGVIYQENPPHGTALWIDIGKKNAQDRAESSQTIPFQIEKNCPVLCQGTLIGCIDYVGDYSSRVTLISDHKIHPSVRVKRNSENEKLLELIEAGLQFEKSIQQCIAASSSTSANTMEKALKAVQAIVKNAQQQSQAVSTPTSLYLAKGMLGGAKSKERPVLLEGTGFNCDFEDSLSKKRDLRTGQIAPESDRIAIIKPGDILETTGLDGVFPRGIPVATVVKVHPLVEGATYYTIDATPLIPTFPAFEYVSVLPRLPPEIEKSPNQVDRILQLLEEESSGNP